MQVFTSGFRPWLRKSRQPRSQNQQVYLALIHSVHCNRMRQVVLDCEQSLQLFIQQFARIHYFPSCQTSSRLLFQQKISERAKYTHRVSLDISTDLLFFAEIQHIITVVEEIWITNLIHLLLQQLKDNLGLSKMHSPICGSNYDNKINCTLHPFN